MVKRWLMEYNSTMDWTEIVMGVVAGSLVALISFLKSRKKSEFEGYNPNCVDCPLFKKAIEKVPEKK